MSLIHELIRQAIIASRRTGEGGGGGGSPTAPAAPSGVVATGGAASASVSFNTPDSGGSVILSNRVTASPGGLFVDGNGSPLTVTGLTNGVAYTFTVTSTNAIGTSAASAASNSVTPSATVTVPDAPTIGTATRGNAQASVTFTAPGSDGGSAILSYTATSSPGSITGSAATSPVVVEGLTNGTAYTFTVRAQNAQGFSAASAASNAATPATVPGQPSITATTPGAAQIAVAFSAPASNGGTAITGYTATATPSGFTATGASSPLTITGLSNGTAYTITVRATNAVGDSAESAASAITTPLTVPDAPTAVAGTSANASSSVSFTAPAYNGGGAITSYTATSSPGGFTATGPASPLLVSGLTNGTSYTFTVVATNAAGNSAASVASAAVVPKAVPGAPTIGTATGGNTQASVAFTAPASDGGSTITAYTVTSNPGGLTASGATSPLVVTGLTNGVSYMFSVTATNSAGIGPASSLSNAVTPSTIPAAPSITGATSGNASAVITFTAPDNGGSVITSYTATSTPGGLTATGASSPLTVSGLTNGTSYTFVVKATNANGDGPNSAASDAVVPASVPGAPTAVTATAQNVSASVAFTAPASTGGSAITGYTVTSSPGSFTGTGASSPIVVTGLTNGTNYSFTVTATNANGTGPASSPSNTVTPATVPAAPSITGLTRGSTQVTVSFSTPANNGSAITGYTVLSTPGGFTNAGSASPITISGLTNGTSYTFQAKATNVMGDSAYSAASSAIVPAAVPSAPTIGTVTKGDAQVSVAFTPGASNGEAITGYTATSSPGGITGTGASSPVVVSGLTNGTSYTFTVTATNDVGVSAASAASASAIPSTVPGAPTIGTASRNGNAAVAVAFIAPASNGGSAITGYTATSSPGGITGTGSTSPITVSGLTNGTAYTFTVTATNANGVSAASAASNSVTAASLPGTPTDVVLTPGNTQISVAFTASASNGSAITTYTATAHPDNGIGDDVLGTASASPVVVTGLTNGLSYTVTITATNGVGTSEPSAPDQAIPSTIPTAPLITGTTSGNAQVLVAFEVNDGGSPITNCTVTSSPGGFTGTGTNSPITVTGLTNGTAYTFTMTATNANGTSGASNVSASTTPATVPGAPTIGTATAGDSSATVAFTAPGSNGGSAITSYIATSSPGGITGSAAATPIPVGGLSNGIAYTFTVVAVNSAGSSAASAASNSVTPTLSATTPGAPVIGTASRSASQTCSVTFTPPGNTGGSAITGYTAVSTPGGITGTAASSPVSVAGLTNGTSYTFQVYATNSSGNGPLSLASNAAIPATVPTAPGTPFVTTNSSGTATILIGPPASTGGSAITSYTFTSSPGGLTQTETAAAVSAAAVTFTGLTNGTEYTFTAYTTNQYGNSPASLASNAVTPAAGGGAGAFDALYDPGWAPISNTTLYTRPALSAPAKSTGSVSYTEPRYGTKIYHAASLSDSPTATKFTHMKPEYSTRCVYNCDSTKFILINSHGFHYVYDAATFAVQNAGTGGGFSNAAGAVGTNSFYPKDPSDWTWHPTDPNKVIFKMLTGLTFYEYDVVTKVITTKMDLTGRLGVFGAAADVTSAGEGRPSDDARYWGLMVKNSTGGHLGYITIDMQADAITGTFVTSISANNTSMSSLGNYILISAGDSGLTFAGAQASSTLQGGRAYTRDFSSFKQIHMETTHATPAIDALGQEVYVSKTESSKMLSQNSMFYITCSGADGPVALIDFDNGSTNQWNHHFSGCNSPNRPGWVLVSGYDSVDRGAEYLDDQVYLVELVPTSPRFFRLMDHRTRRYTYRQEPHATISRDGLRIMLGVSWDNTTSTDPSLGYQIGLPSWIYGDGGGGAVSEGNNLVVNGSFTTGALSPWSVSAGTWTYVTSGTQASVSAASSVLEQAVTLTAGNEYRVTYDISSYSATGSGIRAKLSGGTDVPGALKTSNGPQVDYLTAVSGNNKVAFESSANFSGSARVNNIVVTLHATGNPNLVTNGTFDSDLTGWSADAGWSWSGGTAVCVAGGTARSLSQSPTIIEGHSYRFRFNIVTRTAGGFFPKLMGSTPVNGTTIFTTGAVEEVLVAPAGVTSVQIRGNSSCNGSVDDIEIVDLGVL